MPASTVEELTLPTDRETAATILNDFKEVTRWATANRLGELQSRFNELDRPPLATQIADILTAREEQEGIIEERTRRAFQDVLREHGGSIGRPAAGGDTAVVPVRNEYARRVQDLGFANLGDFAKEIWHRNPLQNRERFANVQKITNDFSSVDPQLGGALIPENLESEIRSLVLEASIVRRYATVIPMATATMLFPFVDWSSNATSTFGGWTVTRVAEGVEIPLSNAKFGRTKLDPTKQVAGARVPNEMFVDVPALDGFIRSTLPQALAFEEDDQFFNGTGDGQPLGVLNAPATIVVTKETDQDAATVVSNNITNMYARLLPSSKARAVWVVNPTTSTQLQHLSLAVGTGGSAVMLMNFANGPVPTMLGRPIIESEKVPALGAQGDIGLYDFSYYLIGDRPGAGLESSPHAEFINDVTLLKLTSRNDGRPWIQSALTPRNGDTLSPFVILGART